VSDNLVKRLRDAAHIDQNYGKSVYMSVFDYDFILSLADALESQSTELTRLQGRVATLQKALDDRFAADQRAAKAIFAETGRTSGFPSVKEVVAFYGAEVERLEKVLAGINVHRNALLRENDRAKEALRRAGTQLGEGNRVIATRTIYDSLSELSADAPAQQTHISDDAVEDNYSGA